MLKTRIRHKTDTHQNLESKNPILLDGEMCIVKYGNSNKLKIGNGVTKYNSLPFYGEPNLQVGYIRMTIEPSVPVGELPLFGGIYDRETYKDLWDYANSIQGYVITETAWQQYSSQYNGSVPYFSSGDGSTTFRVPSLKCWVKGANGVEEVGGYLVDTFKVHKHDVSVTSSSSSAGAHTHTRGTMNITGNFYIQRQSWSGGTAPILSSPGGAFYQGADGGYYGDTADQINRDYSSQQAVFDASRTWTGETSSNGGHTHTISSTASEASVGDAETRPKSIVGMYLIRAFGTITNIGSVDLSNVMSNMQTLQTTVNNSISKNDSTISGAVSNLSSKKDGYYKWQGTILDVTDTFVIFKILGLYTATALSDPRIVFSSTNLTDWYSPYASWHV
jgi:hypothetical protein